MLLHAPLLETFLMAFHLLQNETYILYNGLGILHDIGPPFHCLSPLLIKY